MPPTTTTTITTSENGNKFDMPTLFPQVQHILLIVYANV
jgi:hypothetical protein